MTLNTDLVEAVGLWTECTAPYGFTPGEVATCIKWMHSLPGGYRPKFYQRYMETAHHPDPDVSDLAWLAVITRVMLKHIQKVN